MMMRSGVMMIMRSEVMIYVRWTDIVDCAAGEQKPVTHGFILNVCLCLRRPASLQMWPPPLLRLLLMNAEDFWMESLLLTQEG